MKTPYLLHFEAPFETLSGPLPENFTCHLAAATATRHYVFDTAALAVQQLNLRPFYVELFELNCHVPFAFGLELACPKHFLFFMRQGQVRFNTPEGFYLSHAPEAHLSVCYKAAGHYRISLPPGRHVACCVTLETAWLDYATEKLPLFRRHLQAGPALSRSFLPYVRMDAFLQRRLEEILKLKPNGHGRIDGFLRLKFAEILEYYSPWAERKLRDVTYRVKEYLDASFQTHGLTSRGTAERFEMEERTLRNRFRAEFNLTLRDYFTALRLRYATDLMRSQNLPVKDVYYPSGYNDESTFRYELRKYGLSRRKNI